MQKFRPQQAQNQAQPTTTSNKHITPQQSLTMTRNLIHTTVAIIMYLRSDHISPVVMGKRSDLS
jgi:hypothetical protein